MSEAKGRAEERGASVQCPRLRARALVLLRGATAALRALARHAVAEERANALTGAAALAEPLFDPERFSGGPGADSSLAMLHGLYWLTANLAARRPLLLAVDDLHWCDLPSLRWLAYVLPRMEGLDLALVVGLRPGEPAEDQRLLGQILVRPGGRPDPARSAERHRSDVGVARDAVVRCRRCLLRRLPGRDGRQSAPVA